MKSSVSSRRHSQKDDAHEGQDLAEQKFMGRNAGYVDLEDGLLLAFLRRGERGEKRREQREPQHENAGSVEFFRRSPGVIPKPDRSLHRGHDRAAAAVIRVPSRGHLRRVTRYQPGGVGVGGVDQHLHGRSHAARDVAPEAGGDDQSRAGQVRREGRFRLTVDGERHDVEGVRRTESVDQGVRSGRIVEILHRDGQIGDGKRDRRTHEDELRARQHQREAEGHFVADELG